jgi:dihydroorotase
VATHLGLPGVPVDAETVAVARDLELVEATGVRAHFHQISAAASLRLLRDARARGLPVSADVSIHHLLLNEEALAGFNSLCHIQPPLRHEDDRRALLEAVADGTLEVICSQHTPLGSSARLAPFPETRPGISGLDTLLPLLLYLVERGELPLERALDAVTAAPARCLGRPAGRLETGRAASLCVVDPDHRRRPDEDWLSAGRNSPWLETELPGVVRLTVCEGKVTWLSD